MIEEGEVVVVVRFAMVVSMVESLASQEVVPYLASQEEVVSQEVVGSQSLEGSSTLGEEKEGVVE